jgi:hypothetical protein
MADTDFDIIVVGGGLGGYVTAMRAHQMLILAAGFLMLFADLASSDAGIDPNSSEGKQTIEEYKREYVAKCAQDGMDRLAPNDSAIRDSFETMFRVACSCGVDRGLSSFDSEDFQRIELSIENEAANTRMREGTEVCVDAAMQKMNSQN